jgi:EAL domain-containing protein (putative c-di-GMP-specific phosphodiesterase class I)
MVRQTDWVCERLLIEVTESMRIRDLDAANRVLAVLRADGHKVCLDDFGAGAASFPYIQALDVDYVKIDGAYVKRMETHLRDRAILKAMVGLCTDLGIGTVAEMVETDTQATALIDLGVQYAQGYLFGRPTTQYSFVSNVESLRERTARLDARRRGAVETWG